MIQCFPARILGLAAFLGLSALPAAATSITVETWSAGAYATATAGWSTTVETFEGSTPGEIGGPLATAVGSFTTLGGTGTGGSVTGTGTQLAVRSAPNYGRVNTTAGGSRFLDSNDTLGMLWSVSLNGGATMFDRIAFSISDVADQGATLQVFADGTWLTTMLGQKNGIVDLVTITFGSHVSSAEIRLANSRINDGFGIDDVTVGAVPLPAGGLLLLTGLGGLALARRKRG